VEVLEVVRQQIKSEFQAGAAVILQD
jgi:hypothetical protein